MESKHTAVGLLSDLATLSQALSLRLLWQIRPSAMGPAGGFAVCITFSWQVFAFIFVVKRTFQRGNPFMLFFFVMWFSGNYGCLGNQW